MRKVDRGRDHCDAEPRIQIRPICRVRLQLSVGSYQTTKHLAGIDAGSYAYARSHISSGSGRCKCTLTGAVVVDEFAVDVELGNHMRVEKNGAVVLYEAKFSADTGLHGGDLCARGVKDRAAAYDLVSDGNRVEGAGCHTPFDAELDSGPSGKFDTVNAVCDVDAEMELVRESRRREGCCHCSRSR